MPTSGTAARQDRLSRGPEEGGAAREFAPAGTLLYSEILPQDS